MKREVGIARRGAGPLDIAHERLRSEKPVCCSAAAPAATLQCSLSRHTGSAMSAQHPDYLQKILTAQVYDVAIETPLDLAPNLSARIHNKIFLKREDMQPVFSFKLRGAYNKMASLSPTALKRGVICASAGNHAQGVALSAKKLGVRAVIVMPTTTPAIKIDAVKRNGGEVVLAGESFSDAYTHAVELEKTEKLTFVHPYDDPDVIAGQGTIGMEILRQHGKPIHAIFCCVGGGGLLAGVAAYVKRVRPEIKVIGVQSVDSDAMTQSLAAGKRIELPTVGLFADGAAVKLVGEETFRVCQEYVDEMISVDNDAICAAIKDVFEDTRSILEPAGALSLAGAKEYAKRHNLRDKTLVAIASGANMNFDRLRFVAERAEVGEQREAILAVTIPEKPGSFKKFCDLLGNRNITEFNYRYADADKAHIFVGVGVHNRAEGIRITELLQRHELPCIDLTDDEMAKSHIRYMVGGHAPQAENEVLYRFVFPERPGALLNFLDTLRSDWNISLFHYRNHGADFGRVLVGMQVPQADREAFQGFLARLGYEYVDETANPAYKMFLG
ncbi:MAG: threonine ammonia-lyase, biosynthetic [Zoogloea oleivorans]|uniref:threonine ammonia-lyase, biosynthetic n=1 Tax=Zoogloea oleivorans TaxID=1552750 RepID=UPI002A36EF51|nr:threonine ammonia-lyase, biosynthetic [Zoogloea oleivorans]MDY0036633.1 threonine ammonia-lyase, biosynthetic [Zoogloea oleivorans]